MIWLLHSRRIRLLPPDCDQDAASPVCAGTADPDATCLLCKECLLDLTAAKPRMPKFALANDFFLGRQHPAYRNLSDGMRWMLSLGRPVWRKVYLGSAAQATDEQQVGRASNCLLVAQPTAGMPEKILPPAQGEVEDLSPGGVHGHQMQPSAVSALRTPAAKGLPYLCRRGAGHGPCLQGAAAGRRSERGHKLQMRPCGRL